MNKIKLSLRKFSEILLALAVSFAFLSLSDDQVVLATENIIESPGQHNRYEFEVEPRLAYFYGNGRGGFNANAFGPGVRIAIPILHNGPIDSINNNIAISFGGDLTFDDGFMWINVPGAFQWNFYFTEVISVLGEVGLEVDVATCRSCGLSANPLFQLGGRFQWDKLGVIVRLGYPSISVGANIQF